MKKEYDILVHSKIPFVYVNECKLKVKDGALLYIDKSGEHTIPVANTNMLIIGHGVSLTSDAARLCAKHDCYIVFSRGQFNAHSIWHTGRYPNPELLRLQVQLSSDPVMRLEVAKKILLKRMHHDNMNYDIDKVTRSTSINQLLGYEASYAKKIYQSFNTNFKRNHNSIQDVNGRLSLLNNVLYNFITTVIVQKGLSPSIGFIHGQTRRGGLTFDIADIFKTGLCISPAFNECHQYDNMEAMYKLSESLCKNRGALIKEIFTTLDYIICK